LVKIIFGGTQSMWSYMAGTWSTRRYAPGTWSTRSYMAGTWSTRSYAAGTWSTRSYLAGTQSTAGTLATSGLHGWYSVYNGELLAGTWSTDSINVNEGLWLVRKWSRKATNGTKGTAGYGSTKTRPNGVVCGLSTAMYGVA